MGSLQEPVCSTLVRGPQVRAEPPDEHGNMSLILVFQLGITIVLVFFIVCKFVIFIALTALSYTVGEEKPKDISRSWFCTSTVSRWWPMCNSRQDGV